MPLLLADVIYQMACHWNLCSRFLAQAYTNGIADAISQEGTDTYGTLDSAIFAFAGFGSWPWAFSWWSASASLWAWGS